MFLYKSLIEKECNYFRNCTQKVIILRGARQPIRFQFYRVHTHACECTLFRNKAVVKEQKQKHGEVNEIKTTASLSTF